MKWREFRVNYECPSLNFRQATNAPRPKKHGLRFKNLGKEFVFILHNERVRSHTAIQKCHQLSLGPSMFWSNKVTARVPYLFTDLKIIVIDFSLYASLAHFSRVEVKFIFSQF